MAPGHRRLLGCCKHSTTGRGASRIGMSPAGLAGHQGANSIHGPRGCLWQSARDASPDRLRSRPMREFLKLLAIAYFLGIGVALEDRVRVASRSEQSARGTMAYGSARRSRLSHALQIERGDSGISTLPSAPSPSSPPSAYASLHQRWPQATMRCRPPSLPNRPHFDADSIDSAIPQALSGLRTACR
jgi:hypothetical protein